jgi:hypothetical protein
LADDRDRPGSDGVLDPVRLSSALDRREPNSFGTSSPLTRVVTLRLSPYWITMKDGKVVAIEEQLTS